MKDFLSQSLNVGDEVVTTPKRYRGLVRAKIVAFTPQQVRVEYFDHNKWKTDFLTPPDTLVKILVAKI